MILSTVVTYITIYMPMIKELEITTLQSFVITAQANEQTLNQFIKNCIYGVESISARTTMEDIIIDYNKGRIDTVTMKNLLQIQLNKAVKGLHSVKGAYRFIGDVQAAFYGIGIPQKLVPPGGVKELFYELDENKLLLIVYSPILSDGKPGYDVVFFDLKFTIDTLNKGITSFSILSTDVASEKYMSAGVIDVSGIKLVDDGKFVAYSNEILGTEKSYFIKADKSQLFKSIHKISAGYLIGAVLCNFILMFIANLIIIRFVQYKLNQSEKTKEIYREYAYRDALTGVYSRMFFNKWLKAKLDNSGFVHEDISVVMLDINSYKYINDTYGHVVGDKALQKLAKILQTSLREEDLVIRYGGDEFLLILMNCKYDDAVRILTNISNKTSKLEDLNFGISISYGIQQISNYKDMQNALQQADKKMYEYKNEYKELLWS